MVTFQKIKLTTIVTSSEIIKNENQQYLTLSTGTRVLSICPSSSLVDNQRWQGKTEIPFLDDTSTRSKNQEDPITLLSCRIFN